MTTVSATAPACKRNPPITPNVIAEVGTPLRLTSSIPMVIGLPEIGTMEIVLDRVVDPSPPLVSPQGVKQPTIPGDRWVQLDFTVTNIGSTLPPLAGMSGERDSLELRFALDPCTVTDQYGDPYYESVVPADIPLNTDETVQDSSPFEIPISLRVIGVEVSLQFATGLGPGPTLGEILIPSRTSPLAR
jgi:hypothetical protein